MWHTFWSYLMRCANMKWIWQVLLKIQSRQDCVHRRTDGWTDWRTDGQGETIIPPFQLRWSRGYNECSHLRMLYHQKKDETSSENTYHKYTTISSRQWLSWPTTDLSINNGHCLQSVYCHREGHAAWHWGTHSALQCRLALTHCGLVMPNHVTEIGQHWFR